MTSYFDVLAASRGEHPWRDTPPAGDAEVKCPRCHGLAGLHAVRGCETATCDASDHPGQTCDQYDEALADDRYCMCQYAPTPPCAWCEADHETKMSWVG